MDFTANDWEVRYILESLSKEMNRLKLINSTSDDEDTAADAGNDCMEISGLFERLSKNAVAVFGEQILNFNNENL
jgi:hypothetical protein